MIALAGILLGGLMVAAFYLSMAAERVAQQQTRLQGELMGQQIVTLIKPALLAADPVSLNFVLNQLVRQPHIDAIALIDTKQRQLGRAGEADSDTNLLQEVTIRQQDQNLAFLEIHLNPTPYLKQISTLLIQAGILALIVIILALLGCWYLINRNSSIAETAASPVARKTAPQTSEAPPSEAGEERHAETSLQDQTENRAPEKTSATAEAEFSSQPPATNSDDDPELLIDLLRPADDAPNMPEFAPFSDKKENPKQALQQAPEQHPIVEEIDIKPQKSKLKNPLFENDKHEVQLDMYSFEQELELIVSAEQAGYLLYLDLASGHSDNISADELHELQEYYYRMLDMVIAIYQGEAARISNGNLQLAFLNPHKDDSHGVNAVCASQLFNRLYKLFNQQRIRRMKPVLNLHMALVRGHHKKLPRLQEEARYLTQSTDSNELVTHTALSEAPDLKVSLLAGADIHRAEEDKVLIRAVNENYQMLLDKQAKHLLKKLFP